MNSFNSQLVQTNAGLGLSVRTAALHSVEAVHKARHFFGDHLMYPCKHETCPLLEIELIPLTQGQYAIVDKESYTVLMQWKWYAQKMNRNSYYAMRGIWKEKKIYHVCMARQIMDCPFHLEVDHKNQNTLDNRKSNLRICTCSQNQQNQKKTIRACSSRFKGVSWEKGRRKWCARIRHHGILINLGYFGNDGDAALAYNAAALKLFGEYALLNRIKYAAK